MGGATGRKRTDSGKCSFAPRVPPACQSFPFKRAVEPAPGTESCSRDSSQRIAHRYATIVVVNGVRTGTLADLKR